jgi:ketosteroid isomerase-like protein
MTDDDVALREMLDSFSIQKLWAEYADATNRQHLDDWISVFVEDAVWKRPRRDPLVGHTAIRHFMQTEGFAGNRVVRHVNGHGVISFTGPDAATGTTTTLVFDLPDTGELPITMTGPKMMVEYRDRLIRTEAGWKIAERDTTVVFASAAWDPSPIK